MAKQKSEHQGPADARALLDALLKTGTPPERLIGAEKWLAEREGEGSAELCYRHLESQLDMPEGVTLGTLRKAGKLVFGDAFEPETAAQQAPAEEVVRLRAENENLRRQLVQANAEKTSYLKQRDLANERSARMTEKVRALKAGRTQQELIDMGVEEPAGATA